MPLDGLRAWIGEVERKLGMRTRVFLALAVIAVGTGGAAIFLAVDAQNSAVSEGDVRALQEELETKIGEGSAGAGAAQLETEVKALQDQVKELQEEVSGSGGAGKGASGGGSAGATGGGRWENNSNGTSGSGGSNEGASSQGTDSPSAELQEIIRKAKEQQK